MAEAAALVGSAMISGSMFLFTSVVKDAFPPLSLVMCRLILGCCGLLCLLLLQEKQLVLEDGPRLCVVGLMNTVLPYTLYAAALSMGESVSAASALAGATPIFAAGLCVLSRRRTSGWPGLALGMCGVLLIVSRHGRWAGGSWLGMMLQLLGVLFKASAAVLAQDLRKARPSPLLPALVQAAAGAALAAALSLLLDCRGVTPQLLDPKRLSRGGGYSFLASVSLTQWLCLLGLSLLGSCAVYLLQFFLLARVGAVRQTLMDQLALVIGVLEALFRHEQEASTSEVVIFLLGAALVMTATAAWPLACLRPRAQRPGWLLLSSSEFSIEVCRRTL
ncbi:unnamed protein product [Effrenium voratum]|uniref:EamA domain-containing protein n=1 Tax=Effrenium voratum TaxID=2562239 RepID=A0AA36JE85_9DINO|nr:unnamed protein product [Effrenium voratum]